MKYTLSNSILKITVNTLGAELQSLFYSTQKLEYLWQGNEKFWARQAPILFPIVGKLKNNELRHNNKTYPMSQHGFARDCEFSLTSQNESAITLHLQANEYTKAKFPFDFKLSVTFALNDATLRTTYQVYNPSEQTLPFSIGGHPAFNWPLHSTIEKEAHKITFEKIEDPEISQLNSGLIKTEKTANPITNKTLALDDSLFTKDALIFEKIKSKSVRFEGSSSKNTAFIEMNYSDFKDFGIWTKPGANFVCLEPWLGYSSYEDFEGEFSQKAGLLHLAAGETASFSFEIKVGIK